MVLTAQIMDRYGLEFFATYPGLRDILQLLYATENGLSASDPLMKITMKYVSVYSKNLGRLLPAHSYSDHTRYITGVEKRFFVDRRHETVSASMSAQCTLVMHGLPMQRRVQRPNVHPGSWS